MSNPYIDEFTGRLVAQIESRIDYYSADLEEHDIGVIELGRNEVRRLQAYIEQLCWVLSIL